MQFEWNGFKLYWLEKVLNSSFKMVAYSVVMFQKFFLLTMDNFSMYSVQEKTVDYGLVPIKYYEIWNVKLN